MRGVGIAGICLIRLKGIRPRFSPAILGLSSENAAHRVAVEWEEDGALREGVYIPRRDTSSCLNSLAGGRFFPGHHHRADFRVDEAGGRYRIELESRDGETHLAIDARVTSALPRTSVFASLQEASDFFERGSLGYSPARDVKSFDGLELRTREWEVTPLDVTHVRSSFFGDPTRFPEGSARFDCALLMQRVAHEWHARPALEARPTPA